MKRVLLTLLVWAGILSADTITVFNNSGQQLFGAVYSVPKVIGKAKRKTGIITFESKVGD